MKVFLDSNSGLFIRDLIVVISGVIVNYSGLLLDL